MNTLTMNTNLQSQQSRHRRQQSGQKLTSKESPKSEDASSSDKNNMLMRRNEHKINIPLSIYVNPKSASSHYSKNHVSMADTKKKSNNVTDQTSEGNTEGATKIEVPHPNDVLCGRGGSINAHAGNVTFRQWVHERRESYNLADTKAAKTRVTNEIFQRVRSLKPPGRFLQKVEHELAHGDINDDVNWWSEVEDAKALAKISQALREGAPAFRAAHGKPRKSQRSSQRRSSLPVSKKKQDQKGKPRPKRCKTTSPPAGLAYRRANITAEMDISPPYYNEEDLHLEVGNFDTLFNHNQIQSYRNLPAENEFAGRVEGQGEEWQHDNRFDQLRSLHSHPLVNMGDYQATIDDVANAIPPTPLAQGKQRLTSFNTPELLSSSHTPPPVSPYSMQYEQFDPYSFLSPVLGQKRSVMNISSPNNDMGDQKVAAKTTSLKRENSLSFSESERELHEDIGEFTNPFENEEVLNQAPAHQHTKDDDATPKSRPKQITAVQMWEMPYMQSDPFTFQHVTPPARGLSFGGIGSIPSGHFLGSRKSSVTSSGPGGVDRGTGSQQTDRNEPASDKEEKVITCQQCQHF